MKRPVVARLALASTISFAASSRVPPPQDQNAEPQQIKQVVYHTKVLLKHSRRMVKRQREQTPPGSDNGNRNGNGGNPNNGNNGNNKPNGNTGGNHNGNVNRDDDDEPDNDDDDNDREVTSVVDDVTRSEVGAAASSTIPQPPEPTDTETPSSKITSSEPEPTTSEPPTTSTPRTTTRNTSTPTPTPTSATLPDELTTALPSTPESSSPTISPPSTTSPTATPTGTPSESDVNTAGIAAGAVFGTFVVVAIVFLAFVYYKRWGHVRDPQKDGKPNRRPSVYSALPFGETRDSQSGSGTGSQQNLIYPNGRNSMSMDRTPESSYAPMSGVEKVEPQICDIEMRDPFYAPYASQPPSIYEAHPANQQPLGKMPYPEVNFNQHGHPGPYSQHIPYNDLSAPSGPYDPYTHSHDFPDQDILYHPITTAYTGLPAVAESSQENLSSQVSQPQRSASRSRNHAVIGPRDSFRRNSVSSLQAARYPGS